MAIQIPVTLTELRDSWRKREFLLSSTTNLINRLFLTLVCYTVSKSLLGNNKVFQSGLIVELSPCPKEPTI